MISCRQANLSDATDGELIVKLLNVYAMDPMGGGEPISEYVVEHLADELAQRSEYALAFFAYYDTEPAGLAICFKGFSTFECKGLINIHDLVVIPNFRRRGICSALLAHIELFARSNNFCKLTLEVLDGNHPAKATYSAAGFGSYELDPATGQALFWQKILL